MKNPLVSIVVSSCNYEDYIKETLSSLIAQTYKNIEVIVVDDGSKDDSVNVIKEYAKKDSRIKLIQHEGGVNKGYLETITLGVMSTSGDYVSFCDSDDYLAANAIEKKLAYLEKQKEAAIVVNDVHMFGGDEAVKNFVHVRAAINKMKIAIQPKNLFLDLYFGNIISTFSAVMIRSKVLKECDFNSPIPAVLDWWLYRQISFNHKIGYIDEELTFWRIHSNSIIGKKKGKNDVSGFIKKNNQVIKKESKNYFSKMLLLYPIICFKFLLHKIFRYKIRNGVLRVTFLGIRVLKVKI